MRITPKLLYFACRWLETTGRIKDPPRGSEERAKLVEAFKKYIEKTVKSGGT